MATAPKKPPARRLVWRITKDEPKGTYVDSVPSAPVEPRPADERHSGWAVSSFELKYGLDVSEAEDTVPGELLDQLFQRRSP